MPSSFRLLTAAALALLSGIAAAQSSGTAFLVAPGLLITNHHVIAGCGTIEIIAADGRRTAAIVDSVEQIDLALLRVFGLRGGIASLRTQSVTMLGESATVFGFPLGGALSSTGNFTTGVVSSLRGLRDSAGEIQITAPVQPGNSGGPVLDRAGSVVGVVKSQLGARFVRATGDIPQNVNFAVALDVLADFLAKNNVSFKAVDRQPALETTQVAEIAQTFTYKISCTATPRAATVPRPQAQAPTVSASPTSDKLVQDIQVALNQQGFDVGTPDGFIGPRTQAAISAAQQGLGLQVTGAPSEALLIAIRGMAAAVVGSTLQDATAAFDRKDFQAAAKIWRDFAVKGVSTAQFSLGALYAQGSGVAQDYAEAAKWYRLSATQGNVAAQNGLGNLYALGLGVVRDSYEAARWLKLAAAQGNPSAQTILGLLYQGGLGLPQDHIESVKWYRLAAAQGNANAQAALGVAYAFGRGVVQDYAQAVRWCELSAAQGNAIGQANLGRFYQGGTGVVQDYIEALRLYRLAAVQGSTLGQVQLGVLHENGTGVKQDFAEAARWYKLAAAKNDNLAKQRLDYLYSKGLVSK